MAVKHPCRQNIWNTENKIFGTQKIKYLEHRKSNIWNTENQSISQPVQLASFTGEGCIGNNFIGLERLVVISS